MTAGRASRSCAFPGPKRRRWSSTPCPNPLIIQEQESACFKRLRSQIDYGTYLPVQYGAVAALNGSDQMVKDQCAEYQRRRDTLCGGLRKIGWPMEDSEGTMFAWAKIPAGYTDDVAFVMELVEKSGVLCTPGSSFGTLGKGHVRFALTMPVEKIKEAVEAIAASGMIRG